VATSCVLTPEMTEGPYYLAGETIRSDVTDGRPGVPLRLELTVMDATKCTPIPGATVEIWHADAGGVYSGFGAGASNRTFLRGVQIADGSGKVTFATIYPGWYQGRATHIHLKVLVSGTTHTTQLFFPEAVNNAVYAVAPYSGHAGSRTLNSQDGIFSGGGSSTTLAPTGSSAGYVAALNLGVGT
jgi:protocatechuate 3,4-dioxygenase beta subunit